MKRWLLGLAFSLGSAILWILPGCSSDASNGVLCQPSQLVRCNSCPQTGKCAGAACRGWLQCSSDGTSFVGTCSECAVADPSADSCASLQTCCAMGLPTAEQSTCSTVIMNNDEDDCFALLDQYLDTKVCGGVSNPAPTPESYDGGMTVSAACTTLAPCCATAWHTAQEQGACSALVTGGDPTACADSLHFYCSRPVTDAGCSPGNGKCTDSMLSPDVSPDVFPPSGDGSVGDETQPDEAGDGGWDFADGESSDGGPPSCVVEGVSGICIDTSECASLGGYHSTPGYCPGPAGEECCTPD